MPSVWYFAYGSNIQTATFRGRRGIAPTKALAARVDGWRLVFDKPPLVPIGESFANVVTDPASFVLGILYEIGAGELEHIDLTEGVIVGNYRRAAVAAKPLGVAGDPMEAFLLTSQKSDPTLQPSTRYMALLIEGAIEHQLPDDYVAWLRTVPARASSADALEFRASLDAALQQMKKR